jgi:hypothetical protein
MLRLRRFPCDRGVGESALAPDETREPPGRGEIHRKLDLPGAAGHTEAVREDPIFDVAAPVDAAVYFERVRLKVVEASAHVRESARKAAKARSTGLREGERESPHTSGIAGNADRARFRPDNASKCHLRPNAAFRVKNPQRHLCAAPRPRGPIRKAADEQSYAAEDK